MLQIAFRAFQITLLFFSLLTVQGQSRLCNRTIHGIVENSDGEALPEATIRIEGSQKVTRADAQGVFMFDGICEGTVNVIVTYVGYESVRVSIRTHSVDKFVIRLTPSIKILHDLIFESTHAQQYDHSQSVDILASEDLALQQGNTLGEMVQQLSGVTSLSSGPAIFKPVIQGMHSQRILVLNNGVAQEGQQWGVEHAPEIDSYIASDIEVVKGAESVRYGSDAIGGVVIVSAPPLRYSEGVGGKINSLVNSNSRMAGLSVSIDGGKASRNAVGWRVQGSAKKGGDYETPEYTMSNTGAQEINGSIAFGRKSTRQTLELYISTFNTKIGILRSSHTGNLNDLENSIRDERPWYIKDFTYSIENPHQKINHHLAKINFSQILSPNAELKIQYSSQFNQRREFDIRRSSTNTRPSLSLELLSHSMDANIDKRFSKWNLNAGIHGGFKNNNNILSTGILPDYRQAAGALYAIAKTGWHRWNFELGARGEHQYLQVLTFNAGDELVKPAYHFSLLSLSMGASLSMGTHSRIASHASISSRPPHTSELFSIGLHHSAGTIEEGLLIENGKLTSSLSSVQQEKSMKWINTYYFTSDYLSLEISGHVNSFENYIFLSPSNTRLTIRGFFPVLNYRQARAIFTGGEATAYVTLSKRLKYKGSASFLFARNISTDDRLPMIPPSQFDQSATWTAPQLNRLRDVFVKLNIPIVLQQFHAPRTVYPSKASDVSQNRTFDFMPAPKSYALVNLYAGAELPWKNRRLSIILSCQNMLAERYRSYMNRLRYFSDEPGRNFSIRLAYTFDSTRTIKNKL